MPHHTSLIATIVAGIGLAFVFGALAQRLRLSPLVGYLVAGVLIGPFTPGYVADQELAPQLAEIGVILLMFGVGLHFSLSDLLAVRAIAVPGAIGQIAFATLLGMALAHALGWPFGAGIVFGLALSVASTVVLLRALQERRMIETERGRIAVGWLIVEDLAMVLALVLLPALSGLLGGRVPAGEGGGLAALLGATGVWAVLALTVAKVAAFVALMLVVGRRLIPWILHAVAHSGSRELFRLAVLAIALGVAFGSAELFGVSFALGAFFAGMILAESPLSHQAAQETLPLRDAFAVLFFVSVGMLFDPTILVREPGPVIATVAIIVLGKSLAAFLIVLAFRHPVGTALTISASLAQIGEFSFILAGLGLGLGLMPEPAQDLILAGALISILLNPLLFVAVDRSRPRRGRGAGRARPAGHDPDRPRRAGGIRPRRTDHRRGPEGERHALPRRRRARGGDRAAQGRRGLRGRGHRRGARRPRGREPAGRPLADQRHPESVRGQRPRRAGPHRQPVDPHRRAGPFGGRGRASAGLRGRSHRAGRAGDRPRDGAPNRPEPPGRLILDPRPPRTRLPRAFPDSRAEAVRSKARRPSRREKEHEIPRSAPRGILLP
jgi:monovalent cation:H+ antiporter-2, CPA2 family